MRRAASWPRTTAPIGTFFYEIILTATDSSGLKASTSVNVPVGSDTIAADGADGADRDRGGPARSNLTWTAVDRQRRRSPATASSAARARAARTSPRSATPTATAFSDTGLPASTTYRYRVRAVDAVRQPRRVLDRRRGDHRRRPADAAGLVGAWAFGEGAGTTTADASGNGNTGTDHRRDLDDPGPLRQRAELQRHEQPGAGRGLGVAEPDHGDDAVGVDQADAPARAAGGRSCSARPTPTSSTPATTPGRCARRAAGRSAAAPPCVSGPTASPVNAWTHVALTYDGADPAAVRQRHAGRHAARRRGAIQTSTNPLWIGGNSPYGEYFTGPDRRGPRLQPRAHARPRSRPT